MDTIIRIIESGAQGFFNLLQPTLSDGSFGYLVSLLALLLTGLYALRSKNAINRAGLMLGVLLALAFVYIYQQGNGDNVLFPLVTAVYPTENLFTPMLLGFAVGVIILLPFGRAPLKDKAALIVAALVAGALVMLFVFWRVSSATLETLRQTVPTVQPYQMDVMIGYLRRTLGVFAVFFFIGVLAHILLSTQPLPPPPPAQPPRQ
ncbi:MAG: hypothetical protein H6671_08140 [Anaerolineaceae bacterium]|nr:hypothetical protein [Anaerolineaceae bacterium]